MVAGRRVGEIVGRHVHGLEGGDRTGLGRGDALLQHAHFLGQRRLVTHRRRHAAEQCGHFGAGQRVAVDVVDEHEHVAAFVAEVLGHGQTGQRHAQTVAGRLVHLAVDERDLVEHAAVLHLVVEVVAFTGTLTDAGEHRVTGVLGRDVADQFQQRDGLADAGAAEQADLAALGDRHDQVDDLDAGFQQFGGTCLVLVARCCAVNRPALCGIHGTGFVDRPAEHVHDAAEGLLTDWHRDRLAGVDHRQTALEAFAGAHGDGANDAVAELLLHLEREIELADAAARHRSWGFPRGETPRPPPRR